MLQGEHSAILSTFIMLPFIIKIFVLSIFEWLFYTGFTVPYSHEQVQIVFSSSADDLSSDFTLHGISCQCIHGDR